MLKCVFKNIILLSKKCSTLFTDVLTSFAVCLLCVFDSGVGGGGQDAGATGNFARAANGGRRQCCRHAPDGWWPCGASRLPPGRGGWAPDVGHRSGRSVYGTHRHGARCVRSQPRRYQPPAALFSSP